MTVVFSRAAAADLEAIRAYVSQSSPDSAEPVSARLIDAIELLEQFPAIGRAGQHFGTRELVVPATNYVVIYEGLESTVTVLRIWDARRGGRPLPGDSRG